jgi:hypothetical protein
MAFLVQAINLAGLLAGYWNINFNEGNAHLTGLLTCLFVGSFLKRKTRVADDVEGVGAGC